MTFSQLLRNLCFVFVVTIGCGTVFDEEVIREDKGEKTAETPPINDEELVEVPVATSLVTLDVKSGGGAAALTSRTVNVVGSDGSDIGTFIFEKCVMALREIKLSRVGTADDEELDFPGPYIVDLVTNTMSPTAPEAAIEAGFYDRIRLKMHKLDASEATGEFSELANRSIFMSGEYVATNGDSKNIDIVFEFGDNFDLEDPPHGVNLYEGSLATLIIQFQLAKWLDFSANHKDFSDLTGSNITLSKDSNGPEEAVHEAIKEAIKASADFGKDLDGDGELSESDKEEELSE